MKIRYMYVFSCVMSGMYKSNFRGIACRVAELYVAVASIPERGHENSTYLMPRTGIAPTTISFTAARLCPCTTMASSGYLN